MGVRGEDLVQPDDLEEMVAKVAVPNQRRQVKTLVAQYLAADGVPASLVGAAAAPAMAGAEAPESATGTGTLPSVANMTTRIKPARSASEAMLRAGVRIVPSSDRLQRHTPGLQKDWFTVTPLELVRKATDELTLGLHWFVLLSMVHSSVDAPRQLGAARRKIKFDPANVSNAKPGDNTTVFNYVGGEYKRTEGAVKHIDPRSVATLVDSMSAYQAYAPARDWRMLLRHITNNFDERYYPKGDLPQAGCKFQQLARSVEGYLGFFAHRNCNVGDDPIEDKTRVTVEWADAALSEMTMLTSVLEGQRLSEPCVRPEHEFAKQAFRELREAAFSHLKAVGKIRKVFAEIYQRPETPVDPLAVLAWLEEQVQIDQEAAAVAGSEPAAVASAAKQAAAAAAAAAPAGSEAAAAARKSEQDAAREEASARSEVVAAMSVPSQFALFTLWTRFGMRNPQRDDAGEAECRKEEETAKELEFEETRRGRQSRQQHRLKQPGTLSVIRVVRFSLQPQIEARRELKKTDRFVKKTVFFLADPRGVTNLDLIHRALDATTSALHAVLREAVVAAEKVPRERSKQTESHRNCMWLVGKVCGLMDWDIVEQQAPPRRAPAIGKKYQKLKGTPPPPNPGDRFFDKRSPKTADVLRFLHQWPGWFDSRHMAEFFDRISSDMPGADGEGAFFSARDMCRIRDRSFHGFTLLEGESISNAKLQEEVGKLRRLVEQVGGVAGVDFDALDEYQALLQLQDALLHYFKWRRAQRVLETRLDPSARFHKSAAAVRGLRLALEAPGGLGKHSDFDASYESLEYLLRSAPSIAAAGGAPPSPDAAGSSSATPQVQRIRSGFKALWADDVDEEEQDDETDDCSSCSSHGHGL